MPASAITICRFVDVPEPHRLMPQIEAIFFAASARQYFADDAERAAFRERWLGCYLAHEAEHAFLALDRSGAAAGYLAGALADPARSPCYADLPYFRAFAALTRCYPAHLHINVAPEVRSRGIGARLIEAFAAHAAAAGAPGMHVVTGKGMRNVRFYLRTGFEECGATVWNGREVVLLGRRLGASVPLR